MISCHHVNITEQCETIKLNIFQNTFKSFKNIFQQIFLLNISIHVYTDCVKHSHLVCRNVLITDSRRKQRNPIYFLSRLAIVIRLLKFNRHAHAFYYTSMSIVNSNTTQLLLFLHVSAIYTTLNPDTDIVFVVLSVLAKQLC